MKKLVYLLSFVVFTFVLVGCQSNEDKANKLIKDYMFKHLHDFKSYEVVETKLDTLYNSPLTDLTCIQLGEDANEHLTSSTEYDEAAERDNDTMDIWSGGWSSTSRKEYSKAYKSWCNNKKKAALERIGYLEVAKQILEKAKDLNGEEQIGWIVTHTFRSNTLAGNSSLGTKLFYVDKNIKNILASFDEDDEDLLPAMSVITNTITKIETPEYADSLIVGWQGLVDMYDKDIEKIR